MAKIKVKMPAFRVKKSPKVESPTMSKMKPGKTVQPAPTAETFKKGMKRFK